MDAVESSRQQLELNLIEVKQGGKNGNVKQLNELRFKRQSLITKKLDYLRR